MTVEMCVIITSNRRLLRKSARVDTLARTYPHARTTAKQIGEGTGKSDDVKLIIEPHIRGSASVGYTAPPSVWPDNAPITA